LQATLTSDTTKHFESLVGINFDFDTVVAKSKCSLSDTRAYGRKGLGDFIGILDRGRDACDTRLEKSKVGTKVASVSDINPVEPDRRIGRHLCRPFYAISLLILVCGFPEGDSQSTIAIISVQIYALPLGEPFGNLTRFQACGNNKDLPLGARICYI